MSTLRDYLLDGKAIGETFRTQATEPESYVVKGLKRGSLPGEGLIVYLLAEDSTGKKLCYYLSDRLDDLFVPADSSQLQQESQTPQQNSQTQSRVYPSGKSIRDIDDIS